MFTVSVILSAPIYCRYYSFITGLEKVVIYTLFFYWLKEWFDNNGSNGHNLPCKRKSPYNLMIFPIGGIFL